YVADTYNHRIRKISASGVVTTVAGSTLGFADGAGTAARFYYPRGITVDASGTLYVADSKNHNIRKISLSTVLISNKVITVDLNGMANAQLNLSSGVSPISYSSSNVAVATVFNTGVVSPVSVGTAVVTVSDVYANTDTATIYVINSLKSSLINGNYTPIVTPPSNQTGVIASSVSGVARVDTQLTGFFAAASALDTEDGNLTASLVNNAPTNLAIGLTSVMFSVTDSYGHANSANATVTVVDLPPVITVNGADPYTFDVGLSYVDPLATVTDNIDATNAALTGTSTVVSGIVGNYTVTYDHSDVAGNPATTVVRDVYVQDTISPVITANGADPYTFEVGLTYVDPLATVTDNVDATNAALVGVSNVVNTVVGNYTVTYNHTDAAGNVAATVVRDVYVTPIITVTTVAGSIWGFTDGAVTAARFNNPAGITVDASGTLYVADTNNSRIRKISTSGVVTTITGNSFVRPNGITVDASGTLYVADTDNHRIRKISTSGVVTTVAGSGVAGFADATGTAAQFNTPNGITVDAYGTLYVADTFNHCIRKISASGVVTTVAGSTLGFTDGAGTAAQFYYPMGITVDASGTLYVGDTNNHSIRKISASGVVTTVAGNGIANFADATGTAAQFNRPHGITVDASGTLYVADSNNHSIRKISASGVVTTVAGSTLGFTDGAGTAARFNYPKGITVDAYGSLYVADFGNQRIRKITIVNNVVLDTTKPVITANGADPYTFEVGLTYVDPLATMTDNVDATNNTLAGISNVVSGTVGNYTVTYDYTDAAGNVATTVVRDVYVQDTTKPVIAVNGADPYTFEVGLTYADPKATVTDNVDATNAALVGVSNVVNTVVGNYTVTYNHTDAANNVATTVVRDVYVQDTTKPVITTNGADPYTFEVGLTYVDPLATMTDNVDATNNTLAGISNVVSGTVGNYTVTYDYMDAASNVAMTVVRDVYVQDITLPVITANGADPYTFEVGLTYVDPL
ncbi:MAG: DUF5011 domain-containing protein, partial [Mariprofundaceae bacterium]|nr:DUF5011 domain-containing protein [Mariprofundaceae bacterium]